MKDFINEFYTYDFNSQWRQFRWKWYWSWLELTEEENDKEEVEASAPVSWQRSDIKLITSRYGVYCYKRRLKISIMRWKINQK